MRPTHIKISLEALAVGVGEASRRSDPEIRQEVGDVRQDRVALLRDAEDAQHRLIAVAVLLDVALLEDCWSQVCAKRARDAPMFCSLALIGLSFGRAHGCCDSTAAQLSGPAS